MRTDPDAQAMQAALEALESVTGNYQSCIKEAKFALRERLADSAGVEPVAWIMMDDDQPLICRLEPMNRDSVEAFPVYRAPPTHTAVVQAAIEACAKACESNADECHNKYQETRDPYWEGRLDECGAAEFRVRALKPADIAANTIAEGM